MTDLFDDLDDAENAQKAVDAAKVLSDEQLEEGGLRQVRAFVRTRASKNALRVAKHREKAEAEGLQQVNVVAPVEIRDALKEIAKRTASGEPLAVVLRDLAGIQAPSAPTPELATQRPAPKPAPELPQADALVIAAAHAPGVKGWLIRRLAGVHE
jgi:hypothetical protein